MKKLVFMLMALILPVSLFAAEVEPSTGSEFVINLGTFTGIVTLVSSLVTQILKVIPAIKDNKLAKIGISALGQELTACLSRYSCMSYSLGITTYTIIGKLSFLPGINLWISCWFIRMWFL